MFWEHSNVCQKPHFDFKLHGTTPSPLSANALLITAFMPFGKLELGLRVEATLTESQLSGAIGVVHPYRYQTWYLISIEL